MKKLLYVLLLLLVSCDETFLNSSIPLKDIVALSIGVKLQTM